MKGRKGGKAGPKVLTASNAITASRALFVVSIAYCVLGSLGAFLKAASPLLIFVLFALDSVDGYVARRSGQSSDFGAAADIAADRIVENVLWLAFAYMRAVPMAIPIIFIFRSFSVDAFRWLGRRTFSNDAGRLSRIFVSSRASRGAYGLAKAGAFFLLALALTFDPGGYVRFAALSLAWISTFLCVLRGMLSIART